MRSDAIEVGPLDELNDTPKVVRGDQHNIVVFSEHDQVFAVDNRCPHMGFPLDRGSVRDGILTCHWHQARFDLKSGCTFDMWADDVQRFETWIKDKTVYVSPVPAEERPVTFHLARLQRGLAQNIGLVQAKSILSILDSGVSIDVVAKDVLAYATANLDGFTEGLTRLGCVVNLWPFLSPETGYQALYYATRQIAADTASSVPHRHRPALEGASYSPDQLSGWMSQWINTRHRDGVERTLLTGLKSGTPSELADLTFSAANQRLYASGGHLLESCNKVMELSDQLRGETAEHLFPLLVGAMVSATGAEESTNWHHPISIADPMLALNDELPAILANNEGDAPVPDHLPAVLLGDDPIEIMTVLKDALTGGTSPQHLAREVAFAAATRLARFATSNEVTDWFNPQHTFIHANATYQAVSRSPSPGVVRSVFQAAIAVYMDRFLNVPPARLPQERGVSPGSDDTAEGLLTSLMDVMDQRSNIDDAAAIVSKFLQGGFAFETLIDRLALATVREDLDFHSLQVLDAAVNQCRAWDDPDHIETILVGVARNLAAHCPTRRAGQQTARNALKLQRGEKIFEEE